MKKKIALLLTVVLMLGILAGCGNAASPVKTFCSKLKDLDYAGMCGTFEEEMMTEEDFTAMYDDFAEAGLEDIFKTHAKNIKCTVGKPVFEDEDKESASVNVVISYDDYSTGLTQALDQFYKEYFEDEDDLVDDSRMYELIKEHYTNDTPARKEEEVVFYMEKLEESKKWVVSYDYDMMERVANAITCNLMDTWYDYDYDEDSADDTVAITDSQGNVVGYADSSKKWYEGLSDEQITDVLSANGIVRDENTELTDFDDLFVSENDLDVEFEEDDEDWDDEDWDDEDWEDEDDAYDDFYDECMDRIFNVESSGTLLIRNYTLNDVDEDEDYYILTGDVYDIDIYCEWLAIVNSEPDFANKYPEIYEDMDDGLYCEEMDVYIPKDMVVSGMWPSGSGIGGLMDLIKSGHAIAYYGEMDDEAETVYDTAY